MDKSVVTFSLWFVAFGALFAATVIDTVAVSVPPFPSTTSYTKLSDPVYPPSGLYFTTTLFGSYAVTFAAKSSG